MFIIVVGCGRVGAELAFRLYQRGHQVAVIDQVGTSFAWILASHQLGAAAIAFGAGAMHTWLGDYQRLPAAGVDGIAGHG